MVIESYPFRNSSYGKGNNNNSSSSDSSSNNSNCNSIGNSNNVSNSNNKPIHYKQLVNYLPDDIISLFTTRGVIVECHTCKYTYVDRQARDYFTYDYSICPNCKGFNVLLPKDGNNNSSSNKKKYSIILEREYYNASSAIPFLARKDIPSDARVEVTLTFNSKDDAIKFIAWLNDKVNSSSNSSNSIKVLVTTH